MKIEAIVVSTSPMPTLPIAQTLISRCSCRCRGSLRSGSCCWTPRLSAMFQSLHNMKIVHWDQWALFQLRREPCGPDAADPNQRRQIDPTRSKRGALRGIGNDHPVNVHHPYAQHKNSDGHEGLDISLQVAREQ